MIRLKRNKTQTRGNLLGGLPPVLLALAALLFILYPVLRLVGASFLTEGRFSTANYQNLLGANAVLIKNSLFSSALSALCATALSVVVALRIWSAGPRWKGALRMVLLMTMVSPPFVSSLAYIQLYGRRGWITHSLLRLSINPYNGWGVVLMQTISFASLGALFLLGMLEKADGNLLQAARDLGATPSRALTGVLLPMLMPGIAACLLLSFIRGLADFGTPIVIGGRFHTVAAEIYMQITGYANLQRAAALNILIFCPSAVLFLLYRSLMRRSDRLLAGAAAGGSTASGIRLGGPAGFVTRILSAVFFTVLVLQYGCIFLGGFVKASRGRYRFTLEHLRHLLEYDMRSLGRSVVYALLVGLAGTLAAMLYAYYIERRKIPGRHALDFVVTLPYMLPGSCFGIGYLLAFGRPPLRLAGTAAIVVLNMLFRQLPNATKICSASLTQIPYALEDAARDLGAGRLRVITDIVLPNMSRAFFTCFAYHFTSAMTTAGSILFLIQPGQKIAVFRLFDAVNTGDYGIASLLATLMILISVLASAILLGFTGRGRKGGDRLVFPAPGTL